MTHSIIHMYFATINILLMRIKALQGDKWQMASLGYKRVIFMYENKLGDRLVQLFSEVITT